jgi:hypothetical protein
MRRALGFGGRLVVRLFKLLVLVVILVLLALLVMGAITTQRGWPQTSGTIAVSGLDRPVTVIRDFAGIIQITADNPHRSERQRLRPAFHRPDPAVARRRIGGSALLRGQHPRERCADAHADAVAASPTR